MQTVLIQESIKVLKMKDGVSLQTGKQSRHASVHKSRSASKEEDESRLSKLNS